MVGADNATVTLVDGLNAGVGQTTATSGGASIVGQYGTLLIHTTAATPTRSTMRTAPCRRSATAST